MLAKSPLVDKFDVSSVEIVLSGGAPVGRDLCEEVKARLPNIRHIAQGNIIQTNFSHSLFSRLWNDRTDVVLAFRVPGGDESVWKHGEALANLAAKSGEICTRLRNIADCQRGKWSQLRDWRGR
jgi:hypothetical protein